MHPRPEFRPPGSNPFWRASLRKAGEFVEGIANSRVANRGDLDIIFHRSSFILGGNGDMSAAPAMSRQRTRDVST